jgi:hypothetical protein
MPSGPSMHQAGSKGRPHEGQPTSTPGSSGQQLPPLPASLQCRCGELKAELLFPDGVFRFVHPDGRVGVLRVTAAHALGSRAGDPPARFNASHVSANFNCSYVRAHRSRSYHRRSSRPWRDERLPRNGVRPYACKEYRIMKTQRLDRISEAFSECAPLVAHTARRLDLVLTAAVQRVSSCATAADGCEAFTAPRPQRPSPQAADVAPANVTNL